MLKNLIFPAPCFLQINVSKELVFENEVVARYIGVQRGKYWDFPLKIILICFGNSWLVNWTNRLTGYNMFWRFVYIHFLELLKSVRRLVRRLLLVSGVYTRHFLWNYYTDIYLLKYINKISIILWRRWLLLRFCPANVCLLSYNFLWNIQIQWYSCKMNFGSSFLFYPHRVIMRND